jgi:hypothetical protein
VLDVVNRRAPGVDLNDANFDQSQQADEVLDPNSHTSAAFAFLEPQLLDCRRDFGERPYVIERRALYMANQLQRAPAEIPKGIVRDGLPIRGKLVARRHNRIRQELENVFGRYRRRLDRCRLKEVDERFGSVTPRIGGFRGITCSEQAPHLPPAIPLALLPGRHARSSIIRHLMTG